MTSSQEIAVRRLHRQRLAGPRLGSPAEVVGWLGAVQAQDYAGASWGIAQRTTRPESAAVDRAFDDGAILRTHVMRPTWHFVLPADIRWLLRLTAPRVHAANAYYYRKLELDDAAFARSHALIAAALEGGKQLTRTELGRVLHDGGIAASGQRLAYVLMRAELDGIVCSGPRRAKQFTYVLLDERVPGSAMLDAAEALVELTRRYFVSHGPATARDFAWWSGLRMADANAGLAMVGSELVRQSWNGHAYWFPPDRSAPQLNGPAIHLVSGYDEHLVAYKDREAAVDAAVPTDTDPDRDAFTGHHVLRNGMIIGGWRRTVERKRVTIRTNLLVSLEHREQAALRAAAEQYGRFLRSPVVLE